MFGQTLWTLEERRNGSSLKTGPARPGHTKIAIDITAVEFDQLSL